jgi:hypothetical protein
MSKEYHRGVQLKAYVTPELKSAVEAKAKERGILLSDAVREALGEWAGLSPIPEYSHYETQELTVEPVYD